jgi:hypothetical protein
MLILSLFWRWSVGLWLLPALLTRISELLRSSVLPLHRCRFKVFKLVCLCVNGCVIMYPLTRRCRWPSENPSRKRSWKYREKPRKIWVWITCIWILIGSHVTNSPAGIMYAVEGHTVSSGNEYVVIVWEFFLGWLGFEVQSVGDSSATSQTAQWRLKEILVSDCF